MATPKESLEHQVERFREWSYALARSEGKPPSELGGEWEFYYEDWQSLYQAVLDVLDHVPPTEFDGETTELLLYALARDNEAESIAEELEERPEALLALARASLRSPEAQARWQIAAYLPMTGDRRTEARSLLESLAGDEDEYVRRRALMSLGKLGSPLLEGLIDAAWETGHEYQRMAALSALRDSGSPRLDDFLARAEFDGRQYLMAAASRIRADGNM